MAVDQAMIEAIREAAQIPAERRFWSIRTIAAFLDYEENYVANEITKRPDFPRPAKIGGNSLVQGCHARARRLARPAHRRRPSPPDEDGEVLGHDRPGRQRRPEGLPTLVAALHRSRSRQSAAYTAR